MSSAKRVVHILPRDGLGGAEAAARSTFGSQGVDVSVWFVTGRAAGLGASARYISEEASINSITAYVRAILLLYKTKPDLVVLSLWRCNLAGLFLKLIRPRQKISIILHSTRFAHYVDRLLTWTWLRLASEVWADSEQTAKAMIPIGIRKTTRVLNFMLRVPDGAPRASGTDFIFWGRIVKKKGVPRSVRLLSTIMDAYPSTRFYIFGPDAGDLKDVKCEICRRSLAANVELRGAMKPGAFPYEVRKSGFFIMPSTHEGMAIAVVEAMQLGLVPVVTPVGQIASYCSHQHNAILIESDEQAAKDVLAVLNTPGRLEELSRNAINTWRDAELYDESFRRSALALLESHT